MAALSAGSGTPPASHGDLVDCIYQSLGMSGRLRTLDAIQLA